MTIFAVVYEASFEARFNTSNDTFVNVAFTLFASGDFDIEIDELLPVDNCNAQFFLVRRVKQHALHESVSPFKWHVGNRRAATRCWLRNTEAGKEDARPVRTHEEKVFRPARCALRRGVHSAGGSGSQECLTKVVD